MEDSFVTLTRPLWEYHWAEYKTTTSSVGEDTVLLFAKLGNEGWEIVQTELLLQRRWENTYRALFKRPVYDDVEL